MELAELLLMRHHNGTLSRLDEQRIADLMFNLAAVRFLTNTALGQRISHWLSIKI